MNKTFEQLQREYDNQIPDDDIPEEEDFDLSNVDDFDYDDDWDDDWDDLADCE